MAGIEVTVPDELLQAAGRAGLDVSAVLVDALREELERRRRTADLDSFLSTLDPALQRPPAR